MTTKPRQRGFSLLETLFATTILTVAVMSLAQVIAVTTRANAAARVSALESMLAGQKLEQLRAFEWTALAPSPSDALDRDVDGCVDWLDANGGPVLRAAAARFVRRWSIAAIPESPDTLVLQVKVAAVGSPAWMQARFVTARTRKGH